MLPYMLSDSIKITNIRNIRSISNCLWLQVLATIMLKRDSADVKSRGLITDTERERIAGEVDIEEAKRYQAISRVRRRINEELPKNIETLREHHPQLLEELVEVVCNDPEQECDEE